MYLSQKKNSFNTPSQNWSLIRALTHAAKQKSNNASNRDYQNIITAMMSYHLNGENLIFIPQYSRGGTTTGNYLLYSVETDVNKDYGKLVTKAIYTAKKPESYTWGHYLQELWPVANIHKNSDNRLWLVLNLGFEVCVFKFDTLNYSHRGPYSNFSPLNLGHWSKAELDKLHIKYLTLPSNPDIITVIKWRLDNKDNEDSILYMMENVCKLNP